MYSTGSQALVPQLLLKTDNKIAGEIAAFVSGIALLAVLAQVALPLPWTPVPVTGQTLGVTLLALSWGRKRAVSAMAGYLAIGALGLPVFALGKSGLLLGPTMGYLVGMVASAYVVGLLADTGFTTTWKRSLVAAFTGSALVFGFGLLGLSFFVPREALLAAGLFPFLPGDLIKNLIASTLSWKLRSSRK